jgi:sortase A
MDLVLEATDGDSYRYQVVAIEIVDARQAQLRLDAPVPTLVLTTCYPFNALTAGGPLRYVVTAAAVDLPLMQLGGR